MTLTRSDRQRILAAFRERIGPTTLPAHSTIDDLCTNLLLAIPVLVETCDQIEHILFASVDAHTAEERAAWVRFAASRFAIGHSASGAMRESYTDGAFHAGPAAAEADKMLAEYRKRFGTPPTGET